MRDNLVFSKNSAFLITDVYNRRYYSGVSCDEGYLVLLPNKCFYFTDARYFYALKQKVKGKSVCALLYKSDEDIKNLLTKENVATLYIDFDRVTLSEYQRIKDLCPDVRNGTSFLQEARITKDQTEIKDIKKACEIASNAFDYILPFIKSGATEVSIKNRLERFMKKQGAEGVSFDTIVAFGKNSAVPHHQTGNTRLKKNQAVLMDFGCVVNGYCSDITRTVFYGEPDDKFKQTFYQVAEANLLGMDNANVGATVCQVDGEVRKYFSGLGVADKFTHSLGHGVGLEIHEAPRLSPKGQESIKEGMVFTIEPGLYYDGEFGVRIENTVLIENGIVKSLTGNGRELIIIR